MTKIINLDQLVSKKVTIQVGADTYNIPVNDRTVKLLAEYEMTVLEVSTDAENSLNSLLAEEMKKAAEAEKNGETYSADVKKLTSIKEETGIVADKLKDVHIHYIDEIVGAGLGEKFYNHFGQNTNALQITLNAIQQQVQADKEDAKKKQADYFLNRKQRRNNGNKKPQQQNK